MASYLIAEEGPLAGEVLTLEDQEQYVLGRDKDVCDMAVEDASVSRKHALLKRTENGYTAENLSDTNPLLINGEAADEPRLLKEGDTLTLGQTLFKFSATLPEEEKPEDVPEEEQQKEPAEAGPLEGTEDEDKALYDTIFEEGNIEEPYAPPVEGELVLRVVSGPNVGAEFGLEKNKSYVIGKDPESADIIFNDLSVSGRHAVLSVDNESRVFIEDLGSKNATLINSRKIKGKTQLSSKDLAALGSSVFLVAGSEEALKTIYTPLASEALEEEAETQKTEEKAKPRTVSWKKKIIPLHYLVLSSIAAAMLLGISLAFFSLFKSEKIEIVKKDYREELEEIISAYPAVGFSFNPAMYKLFLTGHVLTSVEEEELIYKLNSLSFIESIENNLAIDELICKNTNDLLAVFPAFRSVYLHNPKAGEFVAEGYVDTPQEAQKLVDYLNANFPYLDRLKNETVIESVLKINIGSQIISHGLSNISFELTSGELVLAGRYGSDEKSSMRKLIKYLKSEKGIHSIRSIAIETTPDMARIDVSENYTVTGLIEKDDEEYSVVIQNKILNVGDFVDGMKVMEIKPHAIYLEKEGLKYKINYNR